MFAAARPAHARQQPAPGAGPGRGDGHPPDAGHRARPDLPGRRQGRLRRARACRTRWRRCSSGPSCPTCGGAPVTRRSSSAGCCARGARARAGSTSGCAHVIDRLDDVAGQPHARLPGQRLGGDQGPPDGARPPRPRRRPALLDRRRRPRCGRSSGRSSSASTTTRWSRSCSTSCGRGASRSAWPSRSPVASWRPPHRRAGRQRRAPGLDRLLRQRGEVRPARRAARARSSTRRRRWPWPRAPGGCSAPTSGWR